MMIVVIVSLAVLTSVAGTPFSLENTTKMQYLPLGRVSSETSDVSDKTTNVSTDSKVPSQVKNLREKIGNGSVIFAEQHSCIWWYLRPEDCFGEDKITGAFYIGPSLNHTSVSFDVQLDLDQYEKTEITATAPMGSPPINDDDKYFNYMTMTDIMLNQYLNAMYCVDCLEQDTTSCKTVKITHGGHIIKCKSNHAFWFEFYLMEKDPCPMPNTGLSIHSMECVPLSNYVQYLLENNKETGFVSIAISRQDYISELMAVPIVDNFNYTKTDLYIVYKGAIQEPVQMTTTTNTKNVVKYNCKSENCRDSINLSPRLILVIVSSSVITAVIVIILIILIVKKCKKSHEQNEYNRIV